MKCGEEETGNVSNNQHEAVYPESCILFSVKYVRTGKALRLVVRLTDHTHFSRRKEKSKEGKSGYLSGMVYTRYQCQVSGSQAVEIAGKIGFAVGDTEFFPDRFTLFFHGLR